MSVLQDISKQLLAVASMPPEKRNDALMEVKIGIESVQYDMVLEQKNLIMNIIDELIAENDAEQIAKSKLVFVPDVEEQIAPTKKTRAKKVVTPVAEDLPDFIDSFSTIKDLPLPIRKLGGLRRKEQGRTEFIDMSDTLTTAFDWESSSEGDVFWETIHAEGDLREFKKLYGNKGEKVDEIIEFAELNEFVEGLSQQSTSEDLPDTIPSGSLIKNFPEPIKKLALKRQFEAGNNKNEDVSLFAPNSFNWGITPEGGKFWSKIIDGDLTEFKAKFGNKGEKVDAIINPAPSVKTRKPRTPKAPAPAPVVATQEVNYVELIVYPPKGGVVNIKTESLYELLDISKFVINKLEMKMLRLNFNVITDLGTYTSQISISVDDSQDDFIRKLVEQFDTFVNPELNWKEFDERQGDIDLMDLNEKIVNGAFEVEVNKKPFFAPPPKPAKAVTPKKDKAVTPKPAKAVTPKPVKVVAQKVTKPKVTKPKVEDDLSFLDDLDNIF